MRLNGAERGATVFVVGAGPQLNTLTQLQLFELANRPTIGVNRTQFAVKLRYFLSAYPHEVFLALSHSSDLTAINMRPVLEPAGIPRALTVRRVEHKLGATLPTSFDASMPSLHTLRNVALGATHLAMVLGATRVVYVGVEQTSGVHFYDEIQDIRDLIVEKLGSVPENFFALDHPNATRELIIKALRMPAEQLARQAFYTDSHVETFRDYFRELRSRGIEVFATAPVGVIPSAGAAVVSIEEALTW